MLAGSLLLSALTMLVRVPILWFLLIVSPLAWITYIFPTLASGGHRKWWSYFIGWNVFLPLKLFFMYIGFYILSQQANFVNVFYPQGDAGIFNSLILGIGVSFQEIIVYIMIIYMLIAGTAYARKVSFSAGAAGVEGSVKARNVVAGRYIARWTGVPQAYQEKKKQIQKEGLPGRFGYLYGGEEGRDRATARIQNAPILGRIFGVRGSEFKTDEQFVARAKREYDVLATRFKNGQITRESLERDYKKFKANDPKGYAYRKLMAENGMMTYNSDPGRGPVEKSFEETLDSLKGNPFAVRDFAEASEKGKFRNTPNDVQLGIAAAEGDYAKYASSEFIPMRKQIYVTKGGDEFSIGKLTANNSTKSIEKAVGLMGGSNSTDSKEFIKNIRKYNPVAAAHFITDKVDSDGKALNPQTIRERNPDNKSFEEILEQYMNVSPAQMGAMSVVAWRDSKFEQILMKDLLSTSIDLPSKMRTVAKIQEEISDHPDKDEKTKLFEKYRRGTDVSKEAINQYNQVKGGGSGGGGSGGGGRRNPGGPARVNRRQAGFVNTNRPQP
jgi:hypothetical protein